MASENKTIPADLAIGVLGKWKETYGWIPIFGAIAAIAMAFSAGANNLPAPFATPVGSGALTLFKASIMAAIISVPGAAFDSSSAVDALFSDFLKESQPSEAFLMWSFVVVLITATIWLALATYFELPVSSQQSTEGALLGTMLVTEGFSFIPMWNKNENHNFNGGGLLWIALEWTLAPLLACAMAFCLFVVLKTSLLRHENAEKRILIFLPIYHGIAAGLLCLFIMYQVLWRVVTVYKWAIIVAVAVATLIGALLSLVVVVPLVRRKFSSAQTIKTIRKDKSLKHPCAESQDQVCNGTTDDDINFDEAFREFMQMRVLDTVHEEDERSWASPETIPEPEHVQPASHSTTGQSTPFKQLLESSPNHLVQSRNFQKIHKTTAYENVSKFITDFKNSTLSPVIEFDRHTLIRHAQAENFDEMEDFFSFPQLLASCIFALIQAASEVPAILSPYGAIADVYMHREKYSRNGEEVGPIQVTRWFRAIGGFSASMGFFLCGWRLTQCLGGRLTYISNSRGLASQLATVATMITLPRIRLPVSSTHAFIGSLVGVGIADDPRNVNWKLLLKFFCGWILTILFCCGTAYGIFSISIHSPAYVVP
ncbi:hypothetical protein VitviT2T_015244 [Vitis vinifera]|uniref:Phosphate transporter n=1 Tax=Vitis vinifera TaxID=29760 RepID=A0ABY9CNH4_VITVI|nr:phosphate-repressible phosphate permease pho-4 [Vitis vinifera]WJZ96570.1 hypothetical protein VitviT2T_015244 [Vitis vinifera]|eukprot:XP_002265342.2 PREDICTED: phosphate-repressible phosphate permease pho-4 [Vitis vinifera]